MSYTRISQALTISTSQYAAGDVVGGLLTFDTSLLVQGAILNQVVIVDDDNEKAVFDLYLFNAAPTTIADNASTTGALVIADHKKVITRVPVVAADYITLNSNAIAVVTDVNNVIPASLGLMYGYLVCTGTPTYTATTDLWLALDFAPEPRGKY
jgi:hypothetical protein